MVVGADEVDGLLANAKVLPTNENSSASDASDFSESESSTEKRFSSCDEYSCMSVFCVLFSALVGSF